MCELLLDTDVLIKLAAYGLLEEVDHPGCGPNCEGRSGLIGAAQFSSRKALARKVSDPAKAVGHLDAYIATAMVLEPTEEELKLAAEFEEAAAQSGGSLDVGESQLCAIAISRGRPVILTGDKRALSAAEQLLQRAPALAFLSQRIACLEQAVWFITDALGGPVVRAAIVAVPKVDTALSICFQFTNPAVAADFFPDGLRSYIEDVRKTAPTLLFPGPALSLSQ